MGRFNHHHIPLFSTRITATISVALVLVVLGVATFIGIAANKVTESVKENMGFVVIFNNDATASDISAVSDGIKSSPGVRECIYSSPEVILDRWQKIVGEDEDIMKLAQVNPFMPELEVHVTSSYAHPDSILMLAAPVGLLPAVNDITYNSELIEGVNSTLSSVTLTLLIVGAGLLIVSFVLIFNTVRMAVYSRRFLIHTMKLVGATSAFIRRPFLIENVVNGFVAGLIASGIIAILVFYCRSLDFTMASVITWVDACIVMCGAVVTGVVICFVAALFAANRYLSLSYDELFK